MDYPQILAPVSHFLHCPTPQAWIDEARKPENLPLLLTDPAATSLLTAPVSSSSGATPAAVRPLRVRTTWLAGAERTRSYQATLAATGSIHI